VEELEGSSNTLGMAPTLSVVLEWLPFVTWGKSTILTSLKFFRAEVGATTSVFGYSPAMYRYLEATHRYEHESTNEGAYLQHLPLEVK
jgi:hypothetical protein